MEDRELLLKSDPEFDRLAFTVWLSRLRHKKWVYRRLK